MYKHNKRKVINNHRKDELAIFKLEHIKFEKFLNEIFLFDSLRSITVSIDRIQQASQLLQMRIKLYCYSEIRQ